MKKALCIFILFSLCVSNAFADTEIRFRGIDWGTSATDLEALDFVGYSTFYDSVMPFEDSLLVDPTWRTVAASATEFAAGFATTIYTWNGEVKVAGYETERIHLYCAYSISGDTLLKDKSNSYFYAADYVLNPLDYQFAYESLTQKLTDLYGNGKAESTIEESFIAEAGHVEDTEVETIITKWDGDNDTHVAIVGSWRLNKQKYSEKFSSSTLNLSDSLFIVYYKGGMDDELLRISKLEQQLRITEEHQKVDGYDGL